MTALFLMTAFVAVAVAYSADNNGRATAATLDLMLPCMVTDKHRAPLASVAHIDEISQTAKSLPRDIRADFLLSIHAPPHVQNWWIPQLLDRVEDSDKSNALLTLLGVPLSAVATVSTTNFSGLASREVHRYRLADTTRHEDVQARLSARDYGQKIISGTNVWWKGSDGGHAFPFDRTDPFHFDVGKSQRFWTSDQNLFLASHFDDVGAVQTCFSDRAKPKGEADFLRTLRNVVSVFLDTEGATGLTSLAWHNDAYFGRSPQIVELLTQQLSQNGSVDMAEIHAGLRKSLAEHSSETNTPLPLPVAPIFIDAVTAKTSPEDAERWSIIAVLFPDRDSANNAAPKLSARLRTLYDTVFKRPVPKIDAVVKHVEGGTITAVLIRARTPLVKSARQRINHVGLWASALVNREFDVLKIGQNR